MKEIVILKLDFEKAFNKIFSPSYVDFDGMQRFWANLDSVDEQIFFFWHFSSLAQLCS